MLQIRKNMLTDVIGVVQGRTLRLQRHLDAAKRDSELSVLQADLYSLLAVQGGESYAKGVLDGTILPQRAKLDVIDSGFIKLDMDWMKAQQGETSSIHDKKI